MIHTVSLSVPEHQLGNADAIFKVKTSGQVLGTLKVSKGAIVWVPRNLTYGYKLAWAAFDEVMQRQATREER